MTNSNAQTAERLRKQWMSDEISDAQFRDGLAEVGYRKEIGGSKVVPISEKRAGTDTIPMTLDILNELVRYAAAKPSSPFGVSGVVYHGADDIFEVTLHRLWHDDEIVRVGPNGKRPEGEVA